MYLRKFRRRKDGKEHCYWGLVESVRLAGKPRQRLVAQLGELTQEQCAPYAELVRRLNRKIQGESSQPDFFDSAATVEIDPGRVAVERVLDFGDAWMGLLLWRMLGLEEFFTARIDQGRAKVSWAKMIAWSVIARFCGASSELSMADVFAQHSALSDLLGIDALDINEDRLYRTLDTFVEHKSELMKHLSTRYRDLFASEQDLILYDLTSTYFEGEAEKIPKARRGYSRDGRSDAKQVVVALVVTREGLPLACEIFRGNRHDSTTLRTICRVMEKRFGNMNRIWVMDRGIASEDNLKWLRSRGASYLVGTPKSQLRRFEKQLLEGTWRQIQTGVEVMLVPDPNDSADTYVLCRSADRLEKEKSNEPTWSQISAGHYLLRASLPSPLSAEEQWRAYIQLTEVEAAFRSLKTDLGVRPIYHQLAGRVSAHIQICFLALCLRRSLQLRMEQWGLGASVGKLLAELKIWKQMDVLLPVARSQKVLRRRIIANPHPSLKILLQRIFLPPPKTPLTLEQII